MTSNHQEDNLGETTKLGTTTNCYHQCIALVVDWGIYDPCQGDQGDHVTFWIKL